MPPPEEGPSHAATEDAALVERVLAGDAAAFGALVDRCHGPMERTARLILRDATHVPDAVQEAWIAVLEGLPRFEGRSSLKTWVLRVLANRAHSLAERLGRARPLDAPGGPGGDGEDEGPTVDPRRFGLLGWREPPRPWSEREPEATLLRKEVRAIVLAELELLPERQRAVVMLRDLEELSAAEVCEVLRLSEANQRVLLHRGRARLRSAVEQRLGGA